MSDLQTAPEQPSPEEVPTTRECLRFSAPISVAASGQVPIKPTTSKVVYRPLGVRTGLLIS